MGSPATAHWGEQIAVEQIGGISYRMYTERPHRLDHLLGFADRWGSRPHLVQGERVIQFCELGPAVDRKARMLATLGVGRGDRVFILGWNSPEWIFNCWACLRIGAVPVLANSFWSEAELTDALTRLSPVLTLADARGATRMPAGWPRGPWEVPDSQTNVKEAPIPLSPPEENEPAVVIFTSGTSGRPKAVVLSHRALLSNLQMLLSLTRRLPQQVDETSADVALHTGPLFHIGGIQALLRGVTVGNTLVLPSGRFDPADALMLIERWKITRWAAVPTMISRVLDHPDVSKRDLRSLGAVTLGGAPLHSDLAERIRTGLPGARARIATGYGLSENGGQATAASDSDTTRRPGTSGRVLPLAEVKIVARAGMPDGEILIRAPTQMSGYFGEDSSPIDSEGWLSTGDLGRRDADGFIWITGRCKDLIIRGGENIAPAAVEQALLNIPGVREAAVFGVHHADLGEEVAAVVVTDAQAELDVIQERLRSAVASFAVPTYWRLQSDPLPVNQTGKVDKAAIVKEFNERRRTAA
jgi:acyl-CoA synthetase (AMP-forming)/AMP-acid ligase II